MPITRTAWIDDDGTGTTGTVINNAEKQALYNQIDETIVWKFVELGTPAGTVTISDWDPGIVGNTIVHVNIGGQVNLTGIKPAVPPFNGQWVRIIITSAGVLGLFHDDGSSTIGFRLRLRNAIMSVQNFYATAEFQYQKDGWMLAQLVNGYGIARDNPEEQNPPAMPPPLLRE